MPYDHHNPLMATPDCPDRWCGVYCKNVNDDEPVCPFLESLKDQ